MDTKDQRLDKVVILIPSLDPDEMLGKYVECLKQAGFTKIIIVNDGSRKENMKYFPQKGVIRLDHALNQGKGRALKTGFEYILDTFQEQEIAGVVTADADGQHSVQDTVKVAKTLYASKAVVLGTRDFNEEQVPFKSRNGNKITSFVFQLLYGKRIQDTQTGLRGIPYNYLNRCLELRGERFEYEIRMLIDMVRDKLSIIEEPIQTIYFESNRATHFSAVKDSVKIYKVILGEFIKFSISGLASSVIDIGIFDFVTKWLLASSAVSYATFYGTISARVVSSLVNFFMNQRIFENQRNIKACMIRYYLLCGGQMLASWGLVMFVYHVIQGNTTLIKICVDVGLFFISYRIQQSWVFGRKKK